MPYKEEIYKAVAKILKMSKKINEIPMFVNKKTFKSMNQSMGQRPSI